MSSEIGTVKVRFWPWLSGKGAIQVVAISLDSGPSEEVSKVERMLPSKSSPERRERERVLFDNLLVRIHRCFWCTGLAPERRVSFRAERMPNFWETSRPGRVA
jgi:hypothetical protein